MTFEKSSASKIGLKTIILFHNHTVLSNMPVRYCVKGKTNEKTSMPNWLELPENLSRQMPYNSGEGHKKTQ